MMYANINSFYYEHIAQRISVTGDYYNVFPLFLISIARVHWYTKEVRGTVIKRKYICISVLLEDGYE